MEKILIYTEEESEIVKEMPDSKLEEAIKNKYDFEVGYCPGGYDMAFLLITEDKNNSSKDLWKTILFKKRRVLKGTVTLDNVEDLDVAKIYEYDFYKEIDGNFEDVIDYATDNIKNRISREATATAAVAELHIT